MEGWRNETGRKTIWEGKYLPIHLSESDHATHLCWSVCVACVLSEMIMCGTLGPQQRRSWTVKRETQKLGKERRLEIDMLWGV